MQQKKPPCPMAERRFRAVPLPCFAHRASIAAQTEGIAPPAPGRTFPAAGHKAACSRWPPLSVCLRCRYSSRSRRFYNTVPLYYQGQPAVSSGFLAVFPEIHPPRLVKESTKCRLSPLPFAADTPRRQEPARRLWAGTTSKIRRTPGIPSICRKLPAPYPPSVNPTQCRKKPKNHL